MKYLLLLLLMLLMNCSTTTRKITYVDHFIVTNKRISRYTENLCDYATHARRMDFYYIVTSKCEKYSIGDTLTIGGHCVQEESSE